MGFYHRLESFSFLSDTVFFFLIQGIYLIFMSFLYNVSVFSIQIRIQF